MEAGNQKTTTVNGKKIVYTYSSYGDVLQKQYFNVQRGPSGFIDSSTSVRTDRFGYTNLDWRNQCDSTNINGVSSALSYNAIGNPLTYRDGMQMTWQNGRQLKKLTAPNGKMLRFSYDLNGQRQVKIERSYGNVVHTTKYFYNGTKLAGEKKDDTIVWYDYDQNGAPVGMRVNGLDYIFRKNLQGDITGIYDSYAQLIVEYSYADAWGAGVTVSGSQASTIGMYNSFRYRGYYYDTESGLYYLNSRYYDPVACRFINADSQLNPDTACGKNLYAYAEHNPVNKTDSTGTWALIDDVIAAFVGGTAAVICQFISDMIAGEFSSWEAYVGTAIGGAAGGVVTLYGGPILGAMFAGGVSTVSTCALENIAGDGNYSFKEVFIQSLIDAGESAILSNLPIKASPASSLIGRSASLVSSKNTPSSIIKRIGSEVYDGRVPTVYDGITRKFNAQDFIEYRKWKNGETCGPPPLRWLYEYENKLLWQ